MVAVTAILRVSAHARDRMIERLGAEWETTSIIAHLVRGTCFPAPGTGEQYYVVSEVQPSRPLVYVVAVEKSQLALITAFLPTARWQQNLAGLGWPFEVLAATAGLPGTSTAGPRGRVSSRPV